MTNRFPTPPARRPTPRRWAVATLAAFSAATPVMTVTTPFAALASEVGEGGESGEAGVIRQQGDAALLIDLGLFEAAHRIVGALYARGEIQLAQEQLEGSHHAFYDDLVAPLSAINAPGFEAEAQSFAEAVQNSQSSEIVQARLFTLLTAIDRARAASPANAADSVLALKSLLDIAAADFAGGVDQGQVVLDHEYRDAWGFVETVRARADAMTRSASPEIAAAGDQILQQVNGLAAVFPDLQATQIAGDPDAIAATAAWVEIIALRLR